MKNENDELTEMDDDEESEGGFKAWLEDNLRIILSILVVFAIAGGIYSYSQRSQAPSISEETSSEEASDDSKSDSDAVSPDTKTAAAEKEVAKDTKDAPAPKKEASAVATKPVSASPSMESKETDTAFIESASRGDGATHLARRALKNYLEKNPDSSITKEQKIYVEDYLRKRVPHGRINTGTSLEFSKTLIQEAIGKSKQLSSQQISHLKQYANRVSSL